jgi:hypothetical protein
MRYIIQRWIHTVYVKRDVTVITQYQSCFIIPLSTAFTNCTVQTPPPFLKDNLRYLKLVFQISRLRRNKELFYTQPGKAPVLKLHFSENKLHWNNNTAYLSYHTALTILNLCVMLCFINQIYILKVSVNTTSLFNYKKLKHLNKSQYIKLYYNLLE